MTLKLGFLLLNVLLLVHLNQIKAELETQADISKYLENQYKEINNKFISSLEKAVAGPTKAEEEFTSEIETKYKEKYAGQYKKRQFRRTSLKKAISTVMEKCPAGKVVSDKSAEFESKTKAVNKKMNTFANSVENLSKEAARKLGPDTIKAFLASKIKPIEDEVEEFSKFALPFFGDSYQQMLKECVNDDSINNILQESHAIIKKNL